MDKTEKSGAATGGRADNQNIQSLVDGLSAAFTQYSAQASGSTPTSTDQSKSSQAATSSASTSTDKSSANEPLSIGRFFDNIIFPERPKHVTSHGQANKSPLEGVFNAIGQESNIPESINVFLRASNLNPADAAQVVLGNATPLQELQGPLKDVISRKVLSGQPDSEANIRAGVDNIFQTHGHIFEKLDIDGRPIPTLDDIDLAKTVQQFLKLNLETMVHFCMENSKLEKIAYADALYKHIRRMYHEILVLGNICFEETVWEQLIITLVTKLTASIQGLNPILQFVTGPLAPTMFQQVRNTLELSPAHVAKYVVKHVTSEGASASAQDFDLD